MRHCFICVRGHGKGSQLPTQLLKCNTTSSSSTGLPKACTVYARMQPCVLITAASCPDLRTPNANSQPNANCSTDARSQHRPKKGRIYLGEVPVGTSTGEGLIHNDGILRLHSSNYCTHASGCQPACMQQHATSVSRLAPGKCRCIQCDVCDKQRLLS